MPCNVVIDQINKVAAVFRDYNTFILNKDFVTDFGMYKKVNICAFARHGTIEFRQHQGTLSFEKIVNWISFCQEFVNHSKKTSNTKSINDKIEMFKIICIEMNGRCSKTNLLEKLIYYNFIPSNADDRFKEEFIKKAINELNSLSPLNEIELSKSSIVMLKGTPNSLFKSVLKTMKATVDEILPIG